MTGMEITEAQVGHIMVLRVQEEDIMEQEVGIVDLITLTHPGVQDVVILLKIE